MKRACFYILFVLALAGAVNFRFIALAQEQGAEELITRAKVEYRSGQLRDPFQSYIIREKQAQQTTPGVEVMGPKVDLSRLEVQGLIWGGKLPQALINGKVLIIGDSIEGAEILNIDKKGVTLNFAGEILNLSAPGRNSIVNKEEGGGIK